MTGNKFQCRFIARPLKFLYWLGLASSVFAVSVQAEVGIPEILQENVLLEADFVSYDEEMREVSASGNVEISTGGSTLLAEQVTYNRLLDLVSAAGNVVLLSPDGNVTFSDEMKLTGFSEALAAMPEPQLDSERTFGKGKASEGEAIPEETERKFGVKMVNGRIILDKQVLKGE